MQIEPRLKILLDQVPGLVAYWDKAQRNGYANPAFLEWFGADPDWMVGRSIGEVLGPAAYEQHRAHIEFVLQGKPQIFECTITDVSGCKRHTENRYFPDIVDGAVQGFFVLASDLGEINRVREELRDAQRIGGLGSWCWCFEAGTSSWSPELYRLLGRDPARPAPRYEDTKSYLTPESWLAAQQAVARILESGEPVKLEVAFLSEDGRQGWLEAHGDALRDADGAVIGVHGTARDVSERKCIETELLASRNKLRDMVAHHEVACEEERKHLAREVHDELGQLLTAMRMDLGMLRPHGLRDPAVGRLVEDMSMLLDQMFKVTRQVVTSLRPAALDAGLVAALEWLAEDFGRRAGVRCKVDAGEQDLALPEALSSAVFRIVQESLTNVARHSQATAVSINLRHEDGMLYLRVRDNGQGFDYATVRHKPGYGLLSMRERVLSLGGTISIDSAVGRGTVIDIDVPASGDAHGLRGASQSN